LLESLFLSRFGSFEVIEELSDMVDKGIVCWEVCLIGLGRGAEVGFVVREQRASEMRRFFKKIFIAAIALWTIVVILQLIHVMWMFR
jgi:hypothetical protein